MVDCSHAQTNKDYHQAARSVARRWCEQVRAGSGAIMGAMLESNHRTRATSRWWPNRAKLKYGVSITDPCIDWPTTERCLLDAAEALAPSGRVRAAASER